MLSGRVIRSLQRQSSARLRTVTKSQVRFQSTATLDPEVSSYVSDMYQSWRADPKTVHHSWDEYFRNSSNNEATLTTSVSSKAAESEMDAHRLAVRSQQLVRAYRVFGHYHAKIDPLGLKQRETRPELSLASYGLTEADLDKIVPALDSKTSLTGYGSQEESYTLRDLIKNLEASYCGSVGVEYMHVQDREQCNWLRDRVELNVFSQKTKNNLYTPSQDDRKNCLDRLIWATKLEEFLQQKFSDKRFGCDGAEVIIPGMKTLVDHAADQGVKGVVIGMAHRGRINVLANLVRKPLEKIFSEFQQGTQTMGNIASGDVKYHLGVSYDRPTRGGQKVHLSLLANPSHLEAVNPVVEGKTAAKQFLAEDENKEQYMSLLIHGDGSFAGQGIVFETIMMSGLPKYTTGGTVHVIINNQISFTTDPKDACPGEYCTDVALTNEAPIFHVNGDDPDAVCWVFQLAAEWRQKFHKDIVVDVVCYRRYGHNEIDQPAFTQPVMYKTIEKHPKTLEIYASSLIAEGVVTAQEFENMMESVDNTLSEAFRKASEVEVNSSDYQLSDHWSNLKTLAQKATELNTGMSREVYEKVGHALTALPAGFNLHPAIQRPMKTKEQSIKNGQGIDWATAEALAFGSLLCEGYHVRISGQDVERGTFSHRHAVLHDQVTGDEHIPLANIEGSKSTFSAANSFLSEYAALGYELGFSMETPNALVIWEAQFGDFSNGAQIIIDQFITSAEQKWLKQTGLVLLLPHGLDGMGPEHSSARLERFLQMFDQDPDVFVPAEQAAEHCQHANIIVMNITTPANYFHALRRQVHREYRKPLIVMSPKSLLRHPLVKSEWKDFDESSHLQSVIPETNQQISGNPDKVTRLVFCSGKVYFDLLAQREQKNAKDIALVRIEEMAPFPFHLVANEIKQYPNAEVVWCQEEHMNQGAWNYMYFNFATVFKHLGQEETELKYVGRPPAATPATGNASNHKKELEELMQMAFSKE